MVAQTRTARASKFFSSVSDTVVLDSLSLVPGSLVIRTFPEDSSYQPRINYKLHALIFKKRPDSLSVTYQRFPYNFEQVYFHKDANDL